MKRLIISLTLLTCLVSATATANINPVTGDYRPQYDFLSNDYNPFSELQPFPEDFWDVRLSFATQKVVANKLGNEYYQPELLQPSWNATCEDWYGSDKLYDYQGIFIYPSRFDIYNIHDGDTFTLSALIYAHPCVSTFQGTKVYLTFNDEAVQAELLSDDIYVLGPTYPHFNESWMQLIEWEITVLDEHQESKIAIREKDPPYAFNQEMKDKYGRSNYSACQEILSERLNRCTVYLHGEADDTIVEKEEFPWTNVGIAIGGFIIFVILTLWLKHVLRKRKKQNNHTS